MADPNQTGGQYSAPSNQFESRDEEIVQVVYQSDQHGSLVGVESTSLLGGEAGAGPQQDGGNYAPQLQQQNVIDLMATGGAENSNGPQQVEQGVAGQLLASGQHEQLSRAASTLPSVAEESSSSGPAGEANGGGPQAELVDGLASGDQFEPETGAFSAPGGAAPAEGYNAPIYSTINKQQARPQDNKQAPIYENQGPEVAYPNLYEQQQQVGSEFAASQEGRNLIDYQDENQEPLNEGDLRAEGDDASGLNEEIGQILSRQRAGAVEKGSFRNNFRKKLGVSVSTNENDLTTFRQKFLDSSAGGDHAHQVGSDPNSDLTASETEQLGSLPSKFKRTHSVSFNVNSSRSNRHSVDIRNLPSYLTHKRASVVDLAKGAMSSLMSSLGGGGSGANSASGSAISGSHRRDSYQDEEPIFEEPIAPTLSLGQRVAMVRNSGAEFGTVGWIGQLPDVDDDWIVGVIFDNMIGDCDGAYNGVRYFYARENYAMFVPLTSLTKTDNYIGRPETGTMLSRMSVSLKPGQLISIQRSSIRLQHCFLNAPHQRVGHDVRAVSNRLHCQCHNCGPCAHLTKQGRINALPHFGAHHLPHRKKNSLAHAAVEMLAHHHHHFHEEEEEHEEKDYEFGDNAAHACNFVRYSCCQQSGQPGHEFSSDCGMVRPELLDNLIHAPKAPARRSRPRRQARQQRRALAKQQQAPMLEGKAQLAAIAQGPATATSTLETSATSRTVGSLLEGEQHANRDDEGLAGLREGDEDSSYLSTSDSGSSGSRSGSRSSSSREAYTPVPAPPEPYNYYTYDTSSFRPTTGVYNTIDSQISFMDQQRFVYRRDSAAFMRSPKPSNWSDDYETSAASSVLSSDPLGFKRILRCLGCMRPTRRRPRRKLSFKDKVLEYRRRQSTFVPSTLAKPHEDFASHGIILPGSSGGRGGSQRGHHNQAHPHGIGGNNSDYSSCSRGSSCSSSRSNSPPNFQGGAGAVPLQQTAEVHLPPPAYLNQQVSSMVLEHGQPAANDQLKGSNQDSQIGFEHQTRQDEPYEPQLNYGDFSYGDGYNSYKKNESSRDSALTDLAYTDCTHKSNSSSDTLKNLVDQSINERVSLPPPLGLEGEILSPLSSSSSSAGQNRGPDNTSPTDGGQYEISSPTASLATENADADATEEAMRQGLEDLSVESPKDDDDDEDQANS